MPPVKSSVFEHFLKLSKEKDGNCRAACKYCGINISGSTMYECTLHMYDSHNDYAKNNDMLHTH